MHSTPIALVGLNYFYNELRELLLINNYYINNIIINYPFKSYTRCDMHEFLLKHSTPRVTLLDNYNNLDDNLVLGIPGYNSYSIINKIKCFNIRPFLNVFHPTACVSISANFDEGVLILPNSTVGSNTIVGKFVRINRNVSIGHDTNIGDFCTIQPGVNVGGFVRLGNNVTVGMGANIIEDISVGDNVIIAAGATVIKDIPKNTMVAGIPATVKKQW